MEVFAKFNGDLIQICEILNISASLLSDDIAIFNIDSNQEFEKLKNNDKIYQVELSKRLYIFDNDLDRDSVCAKYINESHDELLFGKGIIIAILDSGIDIFHPDFLDSNGKTRILYIWDQNQNGNPPSGFDFGTEYSQDQINSAINGEIPFPNLDLEGHGTAVAGIAAGNGKSSNSSNLGIAPECSLIVVKLLSTGNSFSTSTSDLSKAMKYVVQKSEQLQMPIVINISYGTNQGAHDGKSLFEQYLDSVCENKNTAIVVSTGNEGLSKHHFRYSLKTGDIINIDFSIKSNFTEFPLTFVSSFYDSIDFQIMSSSGQKSSIINLFQSNQQTIFFRKVKIYIYLEQPTPCYEGQQVTFIFSSFSGFIPQDIFTLKVYAKNILDGRIDAWLPITEISGTETQFFNPDPDTTLTIPSTALKVISVGGFDSIDDDFAEFSGRGYTTTGLISPDLIAPSVSVTSTKANGSYATFTGTSFAAPFVSGACALLMQWGILDKNDPLMYGQRLKAFLKLGASRKETIKYPNKEWGYGVLCIRSSLEYARRYARTAESEESFYRTYSQFKGLQLYQKTENFNPVIDDEYMDFIANYDDASVSFFENDPEIYVSSNLDNRYVILHASKELYEYYRRNLNDYINSERAKICGVAAETYSALTASGITQIQNQQFLKLKGNGVITGIVDTGIDFYNDCFRYENGDTKILYLWDQESQNGPNPEGFMYGTELDSEKINLLLRQEKSEFASDEEGHGTFISSVIAGRKNDNLGFEGASPDSSIVFVKLKKAKKIMKDYVANFSNNPAYESTDIIAGVEYIFRIAEKLKRPAVINIPFQTNEGSHDGLSYFERYLSEIASTNGIGMVIPVGNQGNKSGHVQIKVSQSDIPTKVEFIVAINEPGFVINLWTSVPDRVSVSLVTPLGNIIERRKFTINDYREYNFVLEGTQISVQYIFPDIKNGNQNILIRFVNPTPGLWTLNVFGDLVIYGIVDIWLPISSFLTQGTSFLNPTVENTVTVPATSYNVIAVGAYDYFDERIYISSGRGQVLSGKVKPDFVAPGVNVSGVYPRNLFGEMTGTGISSAIVAGASSLLMEWGIVRKNDVKINSLRLKSYLILGCSQNENIESPNNLWGYGKMNLIDTFRKIR